MIVVYGCAQESSVRGSADPDKPIVLLEELRNSQFRDIMTIVDETRDSEPHDPDTPAIDSSVKIEETDASEAPDGEKPTEKEEPKTEKLDNNEESGAEVLKAGDPSMPAETETAANEDHIKKDDRPEPTDEVSTKSEEKPKKRKSVGFAPEPLEDLKEHHEYLDERRKDKEKSNPFSKIPPELAYLDSKPEGPRPLPVLENVFEPKVKAKPFNEMRDRRCVAVKDISVVNKQTELNFNYWETPNPCKSDSVLVDIKYASLTSFDISKISKYLVNLSDTKVGLGFDFVGTVIRPGSRYENSEFETGTTVFGVVNPDDRKGALLSALVVTPARDVLVAVPEEVLAQLGSVDVNLSFEPASSFKVGSGDDTQDQKSSSSELFLSNSDLPQTNEAPSKKTDIRDTPAKVEVPDLAKLSVFGSSYCRAKLALLVMDSVFARQGSANILINGGDTQLGYTILQTLFSSAYSEILERINVILVVKESSLAKTRNVAERLGSGGTRKVHVLAYDMANEDLVLPGEKTPVNYKKVSFFASELIEAMFDGIPESTSIDSSNVNTCKIDLFIDIIGSKKIFQHSMTMSALDEVNFPFKQRLAPGVQLTTLFGKSKGPLFEKLMKPKADGCSFISFCKFNLSEPSYLITQLVDHTSKDVFNPWALKWLQGFANQFVAKYSYYEKFDLEVKQRWVQEGLRLVLKGELKFPISEVSDWRNRFKNHIANLKKHDGQVVFEIENF